MRFSNPHSLPDPPSQRSVLIVNPSEDICLGLTDRLTARGYHAESVQDGRMCLERIRPRVFSAVLVSVELPDQDGLSLLDTIRTIHPTLPVIFLSFEGPSPIALQRGAVAVLSLPYEPNELYDILDRAIATREDHGGTQGA